jgi:hypothetical protein
MFFLADGLLIIRASFSNCVSRPELSVLNFRNSSSSWLKVVALVSSCVLAQNSCIRCCSGCSNSSCVSDCSSSSCALDCSNSSFS